MTLYLQPKKCLKIPYQNANSKIEGDFFFFQESIFEKLFKDIYNVFFVYEVFYDSLIVLYIIFNSVESIYFNIYYLGPVRLAQNPLDCNRTRCICFSAPLGEILRKPAESTLPKK